MKNRNNVRNERIIGTIEFFKNKSALGILLAKTEHRKDERIVASHEPCAETEKNILEIRKTF